MVRVRTRKRGKTWSFAFEAGKTAEGKRKAVERGGYASREEAYEAGIKAYTDYKHGNVGITSERMTFAQFFVVWKEHYAETNALKSRVYLEQSFNKHVFPFFGTMPLQDIKPSNVDMWIRSINKCGLAKDTLKGLLSRVTAMLQYAVYPCELIDNNPASAIKIPRSAKTAVIPRRFIPADEFNHLVNEVFPPKHRYHIPLLIAYHTGMRCSEILGLKWENVDLEHSTIKVRTQLYRLPKRGMIITSKLKTISSVRDIPVSNKLVEALREWKQEQEKYAEAHPLSAVICYIDEEGLLRSASAELVPLYLEKVALVCTTIKGHWQEANNLARKLKLLNVNMHSFRHTHATMLAEAGAGQKGIAMRLGHSNINMQNLYTHATEQMNVDTLKAFENADKTVLQTNCGQAEDVDEEYRSLSPEIRDFLGL